MSNIYIRFFFTFFSFVGCDKLILIVDIDVVGIDLDRDIPVDQMIRHGIEIGVDLNEGILADV